MPPEIFNIMEVCGTHTHAIARSGLGALLAGRVNFISGPGCPVCVSAQSDIDNMLALARRAGVITATFGDMLRVPGSRGSLAHARAAGTDIRVLYNPLEALDIARQNPAKKVVFLAVGFETTAPLIAAVILQAKKEKIKNFFIYCCLKTVAPALRVILGEENDIDALLLPGNVCVVTGTKEFDFIAARYKKPAVAAGFSAGEILKAVDVLLAAKKPMVASAYAWCGAQGSASAQAAIKKVFTVGDSVWRGFGVVSAAALVLRREFAAYDAAKVFALRPAKERPTKCRCALILKGKIKPQECPHFGCACAPLNPLGPCMVSAEGACAAAYEN